MVPNLYWIWRVQVFITDKIQTITCFMTEKARKMRLVKLEWCSVMIRDAINLSSWVMLRRVLIGSKQIKALWRSCGEQRESKLHVCTLYTCAHSLIHVGVHQRTKVSYTHYTKMHIHNRQIGLFTETGGFLIILGEVHSPTLTPFVLCQIFIINSLNQFWGANRETVTVISR